MYKSYFIIIFLILVFTGCEESSNCDEISNSFIKIKFVKKKPVTPEKDTLLTEFSCYGFYPERKDSIYKRVQNTGKVTLPLSGNTDSIGYVFIFRKDSISKVTEPIDTTYIISTYDIDTVMLKYQHKEMLKSLDCGFSLQFIINRVVNLRNDSSRIYKITTPEVNEENETNVKVYL